MDRAQAEAALSRALELEARRSADATFDRAALGRVGRELGVASATLDLAVEETLAAPAGPVTTGAARRIDAPAAGVAATLETMLRLRGLTTEGGSVWRQATGWWPDLFRSRAVTPVAVSLVDGGTRTVVSFVARLNHIWRAHLVAAVVVPVVAAVLLGFGELVAVAGFTLAWVALALAAYQYRREAIRQRLEQALRELARPDYRRQPW